MNKSTVSGMVVLLLLGLAFGSVFFPRTITQTTTSVTTLTITGSSSAIGSYPVVTATVVTILVVPVVATCTTVSGTQSIVYTYAVGGQSTTLTTVYPPHLPQEYQVTLVTDSTVTGSNRTYVQDTDTC